MYKQALGTYFPKSFLSLYAIYNKTLESPKVVVGTILLFLQILNEVCKLYYVIAIILASKFW
jgi:hypothetical protein